MGTVQPPTAARADLRNPLLITGELDEATQFIGCETLESSPEVLHMSVSLHQSNLIHGVSLQNIVTQVTYKKKKKKIIIIIINNNNNNNNK